MFTQFLSFPAMQNVREMFVPLLAMLELMSDLYLHGATARCDINIHRQFGDTFCLMSIIDKGFVWLFNY